MQPLNVHMYTKFCKSIEKALTQSYNDVKYGKTENMDKSGRIRAISLSLNPTIQKDINPVLLTVVEWFARQCYSAEVRIPDYGYVN